MAAKHLLEILKNGAREWNLWRRQNPKEIIDLTGADLSGRDLSRADLRHAILWSADLSGAVLYRTDFNTAKLDDVNLSNTDLREAIFYNCQMQHAFIFNSNLQKANLKCALLSEANLQKSDLSGADLSKAILFRTNFTEADLRRANFFNACLSATIFNATSLEGAKNLNRCTHVGPSAIDISTLTASRKLPAKFLKGLGINQFFIENFNSFFMNNREKYYPCFIHYSVDDKIFASKIQSDLQNQGVNCWLTVRDVKDNPAMISELRKLQRLNSKSLLIVSAKSAASDWLKEHYQAVTEAGAHTQEKSLFLLLDKIPEEEPFQKQPGFLQSAAICDFSNWKNKRGYSDALSSVFEYLRM